MIVISEKWNLSISSYSGLIIEKLPRGASPDVQVVQNNIHCSSQGLKLPHHHHLANSPTVILAFEHVVAASKKCV